MAQDILALLIVAAAAVWLLRGWITPPLRRALAGGRAPAAEAKGGCDDCSCGKS